ncbi:hypothetical protein Y032_0937g3119 [Ancylostoma ceylanicum]|uniref:ERAP1-like C-terminal domain-containing protein n=1 Tax=Ancylostoma ceylanicum TaxID=53326 RepID=A0A016W8Z2_9BILA|nr:hypothetical protein Y032_0937g3119 [Ancylostoma ceylanicum]
MSGVPSNWSFSSVIPDFRRSMYCYGLRQNPEADTLVYSLYKYFAANAFYFNRDGGNLLYGLSCLNESSKLEKYVHLTFSDELPETFISFVGENDVNGRFLYDYFVRNAREVLDSDVDFELFVKAMTTDWSRMDHLLGFKTKKEYELMNKQQQAIWETAIKAIFERQSWLATSGVDIISWLTYNQVSASEKIRGNHTHISSESSTL